jgi:hypothetical protein
MTTTVETLPDLDGDTPRWLIVASVITLLLFGTFATAALLWT